MDDDDGRRTTDDGRRTTTTTTTTHFKSFHLLEIMIFSSCRTSRRKFNPQTPIAAVVCRTGRKAHTEFSSEKLHIKKNNLHIVERGDRDEHFVIVFVAGQGD